MSKLFSSVPKRERALDEVSLILGRQGADEEGGTINILVGRSGSGKSTLLRLLSGVEEPTSGNVSINGLCFNSCCDTRSDDEESIRKRRPRPVILDCKPGYDDSLAVMEWIVASATEVGKLNTNQEVDSSLIECVAEDFSNVLGLTTEQLQSRPSSLTPSGQFLFGIACGCVESVSPALPFNLYEAIEKGIHYPILLLDELFDFEHPDVVGACGRGLERLSELGGVVVISTHRPHHWEGIARRRVVTLSSGRVLTDEITGRKAPIKAKY